jgi:ribonucleotide reductase beta subunit family protein with ferritin-like domain
MERLSIYPIQYTDLFEAFERAFSQVWSHKNVDLSNDDWESLTPNQQQHLGLNLAFFANSDKVVTDNIDTNFLSLPESVVPYEAKLFYRYQAHNEDIHALTYQLIILRYFPSYEERNKMLNAASTIPVVKDKMDWAVNWLNKESSFEERLVAFASLEGILFSSTFSTIFGYKSLGKQLPGLYFANKEILEDENSHYQFAVNFYKNHTRHKLSKEVLLDIILGASDVEKKFVRECFKFKPEGFNEDDMINYVSYVTDNVLKDFGLDPVFNAQPNTVNKWMTSISSSTRINFFEGRSSEYAKVTDSSFKIEEDF